jgi:NitT/TauT family transport system substrate-binding protein
MLIGNADYARRDPIASKRVVRAMMRATDICTDKPDWVARRLVDRGFTPRSDSAWEGLDDVFYRAWREYDTKDAAFLGAAPAGDRHDQVVSRKIIATGTDFSFLKEVRKEIGI